ncbi:MAG: hypothetical protein K0V04_17760, partial [Deltaproteobacteria bacterium]|nr:hypothetical protein [Deltaproteobacteria bacterium]
MDRTTRPAPEAQPNGTHALLTEDARLYVSRGSAAEPVQLALTRGSDDTATPRWAVRIEGQRHGRLVVRLADHDDGCVERPHPLADFDLRFHVDVGDLGPVLAQTSSHAFSDGTVATVQPGAAVVTVDGTTRVEAAGIELSLPIPASHVANAYTPAPLVGPPPDETEALVQPEMTVGNQAVEPPWRLFAKGDRALVHDRWMHEGRSFARVGNRCIQLDVELRGNTTSAVVIGNVIGMSELRNIPTRRPSHSGSWYEVARGTEVRAPDGAAFGVVLRTHQFARGDVVEGRPD